jgi:hypothetical protein
MQPDLDRALAMVPVEVERAELEIERDRVENVVRRELEAREKHGRVAHVQKLMASLVAGQSTASALNGFLGRADANTRGLLDALGKGVSELASWAAERIRASRPTPRACLGYPAEIDDRRSIRRTSHRGPSTTCQVIDRSGLRSYLARVDSTVAKIGEPSGHERARSAPPSPQGAST